MRRQPSALACRDTLAATIKSKIPSITIEDSERFESPRDVAAYLGQGPKRDPSGNLDKSLRISKSGDANLRRLLNQSISLTGIGDFRR